MEGDGWMVVKSWFARCGAKVERLNANGQTSTGGWASLTRSLSKTPPLSPQRADSKCLEAPPTERERHSGDEGDRGSRKGIRRGQERDAEV